MSLIVVHKAFFGKLSTETKEVLFKESSVYATSLRMPTEMWPATLDEFWKYWNHNISTPPITQWAKDLAHPLFYPKNTIARLLTAQWLLERLRVVYGLQSAEARNGAYKAVKAYIRIVYPLVPQPVRTYPRRHGIKDTRKAVRRIQSSGTWVK